MLKRGRSQACLRPELTAAGRRGSLVSLVMNLLCRLIIPSISASRGLLAGPATAWAQVTSGTRSSQADDTSSATDAASLQKKANEAQARIRENQDDSGQLKRAVKLNEVALAKEVLLR